MKLEKNLIENIFFNPIKINKTFFVIFLIICALCAGAFTMYKAINRVGQPFHGFFLGANLMVSVGQRASWPGIKAGLQPLDKILKVNGVKIGNIEQFNEIIKFAKVEQLYKYTIERKGSIKDVFVPIMRISVLDFLISFLAPFSIGLIFIIFGAFTIFYLPDLRVSYLYFLLCFLIGVFCMVVYESYTSYTFFRYIQIYPLMAAVAVNLFAVFKETKKVTDSKLFIIISVYIMAITLVVLRQYFLYNQDITIALSRITSFFVAFALLINLGLIIDNLLKAKTNVDKGKAKVLLAGVIIASSAVGLWSTNFIFKRSLFYLDEAILLSVIFPIFMSYAILKKNIFDIDRVIRVSLTYAVSTGIVLVLYFTVVALIGFLWPAFLETKGLIGIFVVLAIIGAFIFKPLSRTVQLLIYKLLFRAKYDRLRTLTKYGEKLSSGVDISDISGLLVKDLSELMGLKGAALFTYIGEGGVPVLSLATGVDMEMIDTERFNREKSKLIQYLSRFDRPQFLGDLRNVKTANEVDRLKTMGVKLLVPFKSKGQLLAVLMIMEKLSVDIFTSEDLEFLGVLCNQAAISIENSRLYQERAKRERLAALGEVASVIIHEVKNPLGIIKVSAGTIKRRFKDGDQSYELATFIEKEVDRMNSTIQQILSFAKPGGSRLAAFNLDDFISDIVKEFKAEFDDKGITIICDFGSGENKIDADPEKIRRAIVNLLMNSMQAVKSGDEVRISTRTSKVEGNVEISVEDTGEGIDEKDIGFITKPFFTTKQEGAGLGLSIVNQIVKDHGGIIDVKSQKGKGAKFTIIIPQKVKVAGHGEEKWKKLENREL